MTNEELIQKLKSAVEDRFIHDPWYDDSADSDYCVKCEVLTLINEVSA